jgi:hypothetical protein
MTAGTATTTARTRSCAADLLTNGIDVNGMPDDALRALIARERDYFQLMLGAAEPSDRDIFHLLRGTGQASRVQPHPRSHARRRRPR